MDAILAVSGRFLELKLPVFGLGGAADLCLLRRLLQLVRSDQLIPKPKNFNVVYDILRTLPTAQFFIITSTLSGLNLCIFNSLPGSLRRASTPYGRD